MYMPIYLYISNQVASCCLYCYVSLIHISVKERELLMLVEQNVHVEGLILRIQVGFGAMVVTKMKKVNIQCCRGVARLTLMVGHTFYNTTYLLL